MSLIPSWIYSESETGRSQWFANPDQRFVINVLSQHGIVGGFLGIFRPGARQINSVVVDGRRIDLAADSSEIGLRSPREVIRVKVL